MKQMKTKRKNTNTYERPSLNANKVHLVEKAGTELVVYRSAAGWYEHRYIGLDGFKYAEFIQKKDLRYQLRYIYFAAKIRMKDPHIKMKVMNRLKLKKYKY
ncbi:hypothetical protein [Niallia nealsonii]|uniref:KTSC domain-containing protein n=1 Tax=Niallia nealsonii TaxID=115979 RepID=A0A2N0Z3Z2_9BACI|nr:hypothetical protein [Niallia nealsonii]PKG24199.1 hypothetical protein CWS01_07345 [Niallia nealsonii]